MSLSGFSRGDKSDEEDGRCLRRNKRNNRGRIKGSNHSDRCKAVQQSGEMLYKAKVMKRMECG
jgi:hypothetical protein